MKLAIIETIRTSRTCSRNRIARLLYNKSDRALISLIDEWHYPHIQEVVQHPLGDCAPPDAVIAIKGALRLTTSSERNGDTH